MKGYIIRYEYDIVAITNNFQKWLKENNKQRIKDGNELETESTFNIEEFNLDIYGVEE